MNGLFGCLHQPKCQKKLSTSTIGDEVEFNPQHQEQTEPLIHNSVLVAEILSFVLTDTKEFARLRRVCKSWKNDVLPYFLEHHSHHYPTDGLQNRFFLRVCYDDDDYNDYNDNNDDDDGRDDNYDTLIPNAFSASSFRQLPKSRNLRSPKFLPQLVHLANHHRFAGKRYDDLDVWQDMSDHPHTLDFWESVWSFSGERRGVANDISVQSLLIVSERIPSTCSISPQRIVDRTSHNVEFASFCKDILQTDSWPQFCALGEEALNEGMFLSMEDYDAMAQTMTAAINEGEGGSFAFESRIVPVIFAVRFRLDGPHPCRTQGNGSDGNNHSPSEVCFQVRIPKPGLDDVCDGTGDLGNYNENSLQNHKVENSNMDDQDGKVDDAQRNHSIAPFVKYLSLNDKYNSEQMHHAYANFKGYNVQSVGTGDGVQCEEHPNPEAEQEKTQSEYYTCHVPMSFAWWELMQLLIPEEKNDSVENNNDTCALEDQGADSFLPLDWLWRTCQERSVQEGVGIMDGQLATDRQMQLRMLTALAVDVSSTASTRSNHNVSFRQWQGRHPEEPSTHHIAGRNALVDPGLYAYSGRHSTLIHSVLDVPPCSFPDSHLDPPILQTVDYWGRSYNGSNEYQWLPTYFDVSPDGKNTIIRDYINNLVPRSEYSALYDSLGNLFSLAVPLLESVFSYCRVAKRSHVRMVESSQQAWHPLPPSPLKEEPTLLRGQSLQVITQIEEYDLNATDKNAISMEESWHVKGMPHEEIVATAMYVLASDENHQGNVGTIQFQRAFFNDEANYLFSTIDRDRPSEVEADIHAGLLPLGHADIIPGRLLVFPNSHVSKMKLQTQATTDGPMHKLHLIVFHLVNPEKRIISTREVSIQQGNLPGGTISSGQARAHRTELQRERENTIPDWNVRHIHLL